MTMMDRGKLDPMLDRPGEGAFPEGEAIFEF